jgi:hypothetical protein
MLNTRVNQNEFIYISQKLCDLGASPYSAAVLPLEPTCPQEIPTK